LLGSFSRLLVSRASIIAQPPCHCIMETIKASQSDASSNGMPEFVRVKKLNGQQIEPVVVDERRINLTLLLHGINRGQPILIPIMPCSCS